MGYESKIYVVKKSDFARKEDGKVWAENLFAFNMCKCGDFVNCFKKPADCYISGMDSHEEIVEDCYGDCLKECSLVDGIAALRKLCAEHDFWRFNILLDTLNSIKREAGILNDDCSIVLLHYGY